jgi:hypothetical protein
MPNLLRSHAKSAAMVGLVNVALVAAWLMPPVTPVVAASFIGTYLYAFCTGGVRWSKERRGGTRP